MSVQRTYELDFEDAFYEVEVWISEHDDELRIEVETVTRSITTYAKGQNLELPDLVRRELERQVELERGAIVWDLDQAAHAAAVDAKISERKEGGN